MRRRLFDDTRARVGLGVIAVVILTAILAPLVAPYDPVRQLDIQHLQGLAPSLHHPFGTDQFSRDVLSRLIFGTRVSLTIALVAVLLATTLGTAIGITAGYFGGAVDALLMRMVDAAFSIPTILLLIVVIALWGQVSPVALAVLIGGVGWLGISRLVRAETLVVRNADYVLAAQALGVSTARILRREVLPNVIGPVLVAATLSIADVILLEAGLSFLGIGVSEPTASWGSIIQDGSSRVADLWWLTVFPGLAILITVFACNSLGDAVRDAMDPRIEG